MAPLSQIQRTFLFLIFCVGARVGFAWIAYIVHDILLRRVFCIILGLIGTSFAFIYLFGLRKTGIETGGQPIWWNHLRPFHSLMYLSAAAVLWRGYNRWAAALLLVDVIVGLVAFAHRRLV